MTFGLHFQTASREGTYPSMYIAKKTAKILLVWRCGVRSVSSLALHFETPSQLKGATIDQLKLPRFENISVPCLWHQNKLSPRTSFSFLWLEIINIIQDYSKESFCVPNKVEIGPNLRVGMQETGVKNVPERNRQICITSNANPQNLFKIGGFGSLFWLHVEEALPNIAQLSVVKIWKSANFI